MNETRTKLPKANVRYEHPAQDEDHCGICKHFLPGSLRCVIVTGEIAPEDWCDRFSLSRVRRAYGK